jgi:type IV pilus assembly protein PilO
MEQMLALAKLKLPQKWAVIVLCAGLILGLGYVLIIEDGLTKIAEEQSKEEPIKKEFEEKIQRVKNLKAYKKQLLDIEKRFTDALKQLPSKTEMDGLLNDINQAGVTRGLNFELFKPAGSENMTEVYAELPVQIRVAGNYADFGQFASDIAKLPRIVTFNDIKVQPVMAMSNAKIDQNHRLTMDVTAKVYRYLDDKERQQQLAAQKALKKAAAPPPEAKEEKAAKK